MCGRYAVTLAPEVYRAMFAYPERPDFPPRYNIAPTQPVAIVRSVEGRRQFALVRWGLLPSWVKDPRAVSLMFNARGESINERPSFRAAMRYRRCLIPADGFYEWRAVGKTKQPYFVRRKDGKPFAFAGLWETWTGPNGEEVDTATIITTAANRMLAPIHGRMPVIVPEAAFDLWLDTRSTDAETAAALIGPAPEDVLEAYPVSGEVGRAASDTPALIEPVQPLKPSETDASPRRKKPDDGQASLF